MNARDASGCVLIVEDDPDIRETLQHILESAGYEAPAAANGREALDRLARMKAPCLVLLDLMMPVMDGWAFLKALDQDEALAGVPIVIVSAYTDRAGSLERAAQVLKKPVDIQALMDVVREHCGAPGGAGSCREGPAPS
ncbi:MAG: response regulator [Sandaracinaceae bacterium]|nr:response regulator [Sandaracinaceae bacterium]